MYVKQKGRCGSHTWHDLMSHTRHDRDTDVTRSYHRRDTIVTQLRQDRDTTEAGS